MKSLTPSVTKPKASAPSSITPARHYANLEIRPEDLFTFTNIHKGASSDQSRLPLVTGFGISYTGKGAPPEVKPRRADVTLRVGDGAPVFANAANASLVDSPTTKPDTSNLFGELKSRGILPPNNRTDVSHGLYESENGQILMDTPNRLMIVRTPRLEGASFDTLPKSLSLAALTVESSTVAANITAIALDDVPLAQSQHVLLVYSTDALNSNAQFDAPDRTVLRQIGKLPVLLRTGEMKISLRNRTPGMKLWALGLDGARKEQLTIETSNSRLSLTVNTAALTNGPTPFFEITTR